MWEECTKCGQIKPLWAFYRKSVGRFGVGYACKVCSSKAAKKWVQNNKERRAKYRRNYYLKNKDRELQCMSEWSVNNRKLSNSIKTKYKKRNLDKHAALEAKRRFRKVEQTAIFTKQDESKINLLYELVSILDGNYHVDHIVPLSKGGLHSLYNLQIIKSTENLLKSDKLNYKVQGLRIFFKNNKLIIQN